MPRLSQAGAHKSNENRMSKITKQLSLAKVLHFPVSERESAILFSSDTIKGTGCTALRVPTR